jgi:hypothetical protein
MTHITTTRSIAQATRRHMATFSAVGTLALSSALLVACGGGGGVSGGGTGAAPATTVTGLSVGTVTGKGSTIVNGVRFDDSSADVRGEDDSTGHSGDDVKVGMEVEIEHGVVTCPTATLTVATCDVTPVATATHMSFGNNSIVAPISNFVAGSATSTPPTFASFDLLGLHVVTTALTTVSLEGAAGLANGVIVEVNGSYDSVAKVTTATRVEVKPAGTGMRLRGVLNIAASTIDGKLVDLSGLSVADTATLNGLNGQVVRVKVDTSATPKVLSFKSTQRKLDDKFKGKEAELEGVIAGFDSATTGVVKFNLRGAPVSVSTTPTALITQATITALQNGARVEVEGTVDSAGVLVASKVQLHTETNDALVEFEFHGRIVKPNPVAGATPAFVNTYDAATRTFQVWSSTLVNGVLVSTLRETIQIVGVDGEPGGTTFVGNKGRAFSETALAALGTGGLVVVYGRRSADGTTIIASKVKNDTSLE